jgi:hypothetical protein
MLSNGVFSDMRTVTPRWLMPGIIFIAVAGLRLRQAGMFTQACVIQKICYCEEEEF